MQDVRPVVEYAAKAVAAEIAHDGAALGLGVGLDGGTDVSGGGTGVNLGDTAPQRLVGDGNQPLGASRDMANRVHAARVAVPAVDN